MRRYYFFLAAGNKTNTSGQMRQLYAYDANDANESTRRLVKDGMSKGLKTETVVGLEILDGLSTGLRCSLKRSLSRCLVSPMYCLEQWLHCIM